MADLVALIERARKSDDPAARELAERVARAIERPDRRVGPALIPRKRGGDSDWSAESRADRNNAYRDFAVAEYGNPHLTPKQAKSLNRKINRLMAQAHTMEGGGTVQQEAVRRIMASGVGIVGERQLLRILNSGQKKL